MRLAGTLHDDIQARRFGAFLYGEEIESQVERNEDGVWEVWILDDDHLEHAKEMLDRFGKFPDDPEFVEGARAGGRKLQQDLKGQRPRRHRVVDSSAVFYRPPVPWGPLTVTLIGISVVVAIFTQLGGHEPLTKKLLITEYVREGDYIIWRKDLPEISRGQVWRIFTPMFLHWGILHILFNMLWLRDLGSVVEARKGTWLLLGFVLVSGGLSDLAQFYASSFNFNASTLSEFFVSSPLFGGMSGVVYGLLGYVWMQGKFNPASKMGLPRHVVIMMAIWFFVCFTGLVGNIGNTAHAVGALVGIAWGYISARVAPG
jgi:GlpG protein